ncbi:MAG TPA: FtsQ-type POTRA domain-containing protein, partial [Acidimicrobiales bacterium]
MERPTPRREPSPAPRSRRRVKPRRSTTVLLSLGLIVTALALSTQLVLHSSLLRVQHVTLVGEVHESANQVLLATGLSDHPMMLSVSSKSLTRDLSMFPWVRRVEVIKHWPDSLTVRVSELRPVAVAYDAQGRLRFVSAQGRDLGAAPLNANYPTLVYQNPLRATWPFHVAGRSAAQVAAALPRAFSDQVDEIKVDADGEVTLTMTTPVTFVLGEATELQQKFVAIASVIAHSTLRAGDVIDVSVPDELAVSGPAPS